MNARKLLLAILLVVATGFPSLDGWARSSSSRGYSAPAQTRQAAPAPSTSKSTNGYAVPGQSSEGSPASTTARSPLTGSDAAMSKQASGSALRNYSTAKEQPSFARGTGPAAAASPAFSSYSGRFHSYDDYYARRGSYYDGFGWRPPMYAYSSRSSFGMWDAMFMWFMLDSISNASHAMWFHNHSDDPGYAQWRQEADRLAADNADLRTKLDALDAKQKETAGQPRDPSYMPPDAKPELALAAENAVVPQPSSTGPNWLVDGLAVLAVGGLFLFLRRRRAIA
jgi:hypothetical protein